MNGRFRKASALLGTAALVTGGLMALLAAPAAASGPMITNLSVVPTSSTTATVAWAGDGAPFPPSFVTVSCSSSINGTGPFTAAFAGNGSVNYYFTGAAGPYTVSGLTAATNNLLTCSAYETDTSGPVTSPTATASAYLPVAPPTPTVTGVQETGNGNVLVSFNGDGVPGSSFTASCVSSAGGGASGSGTSSPILVTYLPAVPVQGVSCSVTETGPNGVSSASSGSGGTTVVITPGPGCAGTATAPTNLSAVAMAFPGAVVSWAPATVTPASCLAGYLVTPTSGSTALTPTFVLGHGTTTNVLGLTEGTSYTFTVAAVTGSGPGPASAPIGPITIGAPAKPSAVRATAAGRTAIKVSFKAGRNNGAAITGFVATCGSKSTRGKASPLTVKGLTAGKTYTCTVAAVNSRGKGAAARSGSVKA